MDDVTAALRRPGLDPARIHTERFGSRSPINPGVVRADAPPPHQPPGPPGAGPDVTFARSGLTTAWSDELRVGARARRGLRRTDAVVVPHRRLPHLRDRRAVRRGVVRDAPARAARRGRGADLLGAAERRRSCSTSDPAPTAEPATRSGGRLRQVLRVGKTSSDSASASASLAAAFMSSAATLSTARSTIASAWSSALRILTTPGSETRARIPEWPGAMRVLELFLDLAVVVTLTDLARGRTGRAQHRGAAEDRRREQHAERDTADEAPAEPVLGAVVGRLLHLELALRVALDHEDALDLDGPTVLHGLQGLVGLPRRVGVGEVGDEERVRTVAQRGTRHLCLVSAVLVF